MWTPRWLLAYFRNLRPYTKEPASVHAVQIINYMIQWNIIVFMLTCFLSLGDYHPVSNPTEIITGYTGIIKLQN